MSAKILEQRPKKWSILWGFEGFRHFEGIILVLSDEALEFLVL